MSDPLPQSKVPPLNSENTDAKAKAGLPVPGSALPAIRKKHWGQRIALGLFLILVLIGIFVLLAPTLAGTAPVRRAILSKLNEQLNGSIEIQNWSFGWTGGIQMDGIKVFDDRKAEILSVAHLRSGLSLLDAIRGRFHCGETVIDEPNLEQFIVYPDGSNNFQKLPRQGPSKAHDSQNIPVNEPVKNRAETAKKEGESSKSMDIQGHFTVNRLRGFIQDQRSGEPIIIAPESSMSVRINTLAEPIENSLLLVYRVGTNGLPGTIKIGGTAETGERGNIDEKLELSSVSLAAVNPLFAMAGKKLELGGVVNGAIAIKAATSAPFSVEGQITADRFTARGGALQGETYSTGKLNIPVKFSGSSTDPKTARLRIESLGIQTDQATIGLTGEISLAALQNAMQGRAPGSDGKLTLAFDITNVKPLADQLPKTLHLQDGVKLAAGQFYHETNIWLSAGKTVVESKTDIQSIAGMNKDRPIVLSPIHQTTDVTLLPGTAMVADLHDLAITLVSGFATIEGGGKTLADVDLKGNVDLPKLQKELGQFVDFGKVNLGGTAEFAIRTNGDPTKTGTPIKLDVKATVANLVTGGLEGATKTDLPPLKVTSGTANIKVSTVRDGASGKTQFQDGQFIVKQLVLERGESKYISANDAVAIQFAGEVIATDRVRGITVSNFSGTAFGGTIKMPEPLVVTGLGGAVNANGSIELTGKMVDIARLLETLQAKPVGKGFPFQGDYRLVEKVDTKGDVIALTGEVAIADFQVNDAAGRQQVFAEKQISLNNQLSYDSRLKNLNITMLKLDMSGSDALHLTVGGSVQDMGGRQALDNLKVTLGYDLEKLWPIIYQMLTPAQQTDLKDAQVSGKFEKIFTIAGSYPSGKLFNDAVGSLKVNGSLGIGRFNGMGVDLAKLDLPLSLDGGMLRFVYADRPENQQLPIPAYLNGGQFNPGGAIIDLKGRESRLTLPKDWKLITSATINPLLGDNLGKYINPVFANSERAKGLLDVTVGYCEGVALGEGMKTKNSGKAKMLFAIRDMAIASPLGSQMIGGLTKAIPSDLLGLLGNGKGLNLGGGARAEADGSQSPSDVFSGEIKDAVVTLEEGITTQDVMLQLADPALKAQAMAGKPAVAGVGFMPLHFKGDIHLADLQQNLNVTFPTELLARFIRAKGVGKTLADIFPAGIPLTLKGTTTKPRIDLGDITQRLVEGFTQANLKSITGGKGDKNGDVIGGLIDALGGNKKKKDRKGD